MSNISIAKIIRFFVLFDSGLVVKRRMNKESSRMSRAQEKEMDQDRMVEDGNLNRMEEVQIEHDGDRMTLMDLDIGENLSAAADTHRSHPGLPDPSNGPSTTITGSGGTPLAETADLLGLGGNGSGSPEESHDDVLSNKDPAVWTHGMFPHISASHPEAWLLNSNNWIVHIVESWNRNMFKPNWFV